MLLSAIAGLAISAQSSYRQRFPLPDATVGSGLGVNIHFVREEKPGEMRLITQTGFKWIRMNIFWSEIEGIRGTYGFNRFDDLIKACERNNVRPMLIFSFDNSIWSKDSPRTPELRRAFSGYVEAVVTRFKGKGIIWEMWNEPNYKLFWKPEPNVDEYIALAKEVGRTIRRIAPDEYYVGPACAWFDWPFLEKCFQSGLLEYFDAVTVHPYRDTDPETVTTEWKRLRALVDKYSPSGKSIPMWNSEWGYSELFPRMNENAQAQYAVRLYLTNLSAGVNFSIHYGWKNDMWQSKEMQRRFGTVDHNLRPKPTFFAFQKMIKAIGGYRYVGRIETAGHIHALVFRKSSIYKLAAWSTTPQGTLRIGDRTFNLNSGPQYFTVDDSYEKIARL